MSLLGDTIEVKTAVVSTDYNNQQLETLSKHPYGLSWVAIEQGFCRDIAIHKFANETPVE